MKNLKKYSVFMLALIMLFSAFVVPVNADADDAVGNNIDNSITLDHRLGDLSGDGIVSIIDARLCLRAAIHLDKLTSEQFAAADVFNNGRITAQNARHLLRCTAGIGSSVYAVTKEINIGDELKTSGLFVNGSGKYTWKYTVDDPDAISVVYDSVYTPEYDEYGNPIIGRGAEEIFTFTALKAGKFTIHLEQTYLHSDYFDNSKYQEYKRSDCYVNVVVRDPEQYGG